jgi:uncharacterized membrane protein
MLDACCLSLFLCYFVYFIFSKKKKNKKKIFFFFFFLRVCLVCFLFSLNFV